MKCNTVLKKKTHKTFTIKNTLGKVCCIATNNGYIYLKIAVIKND